MRTLLYLIAMVGLDVHAQSLPAAGSVPNTVQSVIVGQTKIQSTSVEATDQLAMQVWGLSVEELQRARMLLQGPRASFSVPNLSPVEALGIHARNDAERRKYAEKFARAQHEDTERVLAWAMAYQVAMQRLYPNDKVIDFTGLSSIDVPAGAAAAANVPHGVGRPVKRAGGAQQ